MESKQSFELNLLPVISLLAVCISFLLLTSVWVHIGSLDISQAIGTESDSKVQPNINVTFENDNLVFQVKDSQKVPEKKYVISSGKKGYDWKKINQYTSYILSKEPSLKMALILPAQRSKYQDIIQLIDSFKNQGISDVGIAPL